MLRLIMICALFELVTVGTWSNSFIGRHNQDNRDDTQTFLDVDFCELVRNPDKYDKKQVRVKAVLLENHEFRVDGGDPHFYSPNCLGEERAILAEEHKDRQKDDLEVVNSLQLLRKQRDKYGSSRVWVLLQAFLRKQIKVVLAIWIGRNSESR